MPEGQKLPPGQVATGTSADSVGRQHKNGWEGQDAVIFESPDTYVDFAERTDIDDLVRVYNSHPAFIAHHLNRNAVTRDWMAGEMTAGRDANFWSCKVVGKSSRHVVGLMDVRIEAETYLSLLMIHRSYAHQGIGKQVYDALEIYLRSQRSHSIRIDVVVGYDDRVLDFWLRNGFRIVEDTTLDWSGVALPAVMMKKRLS